jgi:diguanylate cyclase (GGDEF)-like protein
VNTLNSSSPISILLENPDYQSDTFSPEDYDLTLELDESARGMPFEPFVSIIQFAFLKLDQSAVDQILELPKTFTTLKPIIQRYVLGKPPGRREPLNTDELEYEQQTFFTAFEGILQACLGALPLKVAVLNSQFISPSAFKFLQRNDYRVPSSLALDFYLTSDAFHTLKISQGFSTQIKRRHISVAPGTGRKIKSIHTHKIRLTENRYWEALRNAISLYNDQEMLYLADYLSQKNLTTDQHAELTMTRMYAWLLQKESAHCHIYLHELKHLDSTTLPGKALTRSLKAVAVGYLCMRENDAAEDAIQQYRRAAVAIDSARDILLAEFYLFLAQSFSGRCQLSTAELIDLATRLDDMGWPNLSAFVNCSHWFNEALIDTESDSVITHALHAIDAFEQSHNYVGQSTAHHHISIVLGSVGRPKEAIAHIHRALSLTKKFGVTERIYNTLNGLAFFLNGLGQTDQALSAVEDSYALVVADVDFSQICTTLFNYALIAFYGNDQRKTIQIVDDIFTIMEHRNMASTRFRTKNELLALQALAAYFDGDQRLVFAVKPQLTSEPARSHEGAAFIRCIDLITQSLSADEAEQYFIDISDQFSHLRQNKHLDLLALRILVQYLAESGEQLRAETWRQQGLRQCRDYQLEARENWFKDSATTAVIHTNIDPKQAINLAQRQLGLDALRLENDLLTMLNSLSDSALRCGNIKQLLQTVIQNLERMPNIRQARITLNVKSEPSVTEAFDGTHEYADLASAKQHTFPLRFIGGSGEMEVSFLGGVILRAHDAKPLMKKICDRLSRDIELLLERIESFQKAYLDPLTSVFNRFALEEDLDALLKKGEHHQICLAFIDIDHFKIVNDELGHLAGDTLLRAFVDQLGKNLRTEDRIYRIGGDEFIVCFKDIDANKAASALLRFQASVFNPTRLSALGVNASTLPNCSIGLIEYRLNTETPITRIQLIEAADALMYQAKESETEKVQMQRLA